MKLKIPKQEYTAEFKELAVKRVKAGQGIGAVARELGLIEQTLRNWVKAAAAGKLSGAGCKAITPEQMELSRLRTENIRPPSLAGRMRFRARRASISLAAAIYVWIAEPTRRSAHRPLRFSMSA